MDTRPRVLSLFSGAGGGELATQQLLGWRTVCYVEIDTYCQRVLRARIADGYLDDAPIWDNIQTFDGRPWRGCVDIITAGFPCQPFSLAGKRRGKGDSRNLWPNTARVIREVRPRWALLENVPGLLARSHGYFGAVLGELAESGYDVRWDCIPASSVGAPHQRDRLWIVAYSHSGRQPQQPQRDSETGQNRPSFGDDSLRLCDEVGYTDRERTQGLSVSASTKHTRSAGGGWWETEPEVGRVVNGLANRLDRLKSIGNGQVPLVAAKAWRRLMEVRR